jgi:hypothetical protein
MPACEAGGVRGVTGLSERTPGCDDTGAELELGAASHVFFASCMDIFMS